MAKAREIPGLETDLPYGEVAARVLEVRMEELVDHSENVLDMEEIEGVHDMRVATRRLRAALEVFRPCFPADEGKRVLKEVKALADALGERRDRDVAIDALAGFAAAMPAPDRPGIGSLIDRYAAEQEQANVDLVPFVDESRLERLRERVLELAAAARESVESVDPFLGGGADPERGGRVVKARKVKKLDPRSTLGENAARIVLVRVDELRSFAPGALEPAESEVQHDHADRRQAAPLRARGHGLLLRAPRDDGAAKGEGDPGPARRDPRLRRDAARSFTSIGGACASTTRRPSRPGPATLPTSIPSLRPAPPTARPTAASRCSRST